MEDRERKTPVHFRGQKVKSHVTFDLLLKNFQIGHNFFILRDRAFIFGMCVHYDNTFPAVHEHVTFTVTFDLLLQNFVISHNFLILRDRAFIFGKCVPFDKAFLMITNFERVTLTVTSTYF